MDRKVKEKFIRDEDLFVRHLSEHETLLEVAESKSCKVYPNVDQNLRKRVTNSLGRLCLHQPRTFKCFNPILSRNFSHLQHLL